MTRYSTSAALEMAVKAAAAQSPVETGRAITSFYFHRLLCRVFSSENTTFILKGGQALLARTPEARATRDIDLLSQGNDLDAALRELIKLVETDLDDFITFEFAEVMPIKANEEYRSGISVRFIPTLGFKRMQTIRIDLVVDEVDLEKTELITPADTLQVDGLKTCDYRVYPVENALADKLCALLEKHDGRPSSRVKDLVDIAVYAGACVIDGNKLQKVIHREASVRHLAVPESFQVPEEWGRSQEKQYEKMWLQTGLPESLKTIRGAVTLSEALFNPAVKMQLEKMIWNPSLLQWEKKVS